MSRSKIINFEEVMWKKFPGHEGTFSKAIVGPGGFVDNTKVDFRVTIYEPGGYVKTHSHKKADHIYYCLDGQGIITLDRVNHIVGPGTTIYIPEGVEHSIINTGSKSFHLIVIFIPPEQ